MNIMKYAKITERLADLGGAKWAIHFRARQLKAAGRKVIEMTIGEPDVPTPATLIEAAKSALDAGRTGYSNGRGEAELLTTLAARYSARRGRPFSEKNFLCLPGTQTVLFLIFSVLVDEGDEVLVADPMYATYEGIIRASGGTVVPVPLRPEAGFRLRAEDVAARITPRARVLFLNSPHNPSGAVLSRKDIAALGELARAHDLWIVSDEVYEDLVFPGVTFASPLDFPDLAERTIAASSISKSHAAPGFRSGWCVGPEDFVERALPVAETMLFGNQPFLADATAVAVSAPSEVAAGMAARFQRRAAILRDRLSGTKGISVSSPEAGMFALVDIRPTGMTGEAFALALLEQEGVAVMPGESFGTGLSGWLRVSLTRPDNEVIAAADAISRFVATRRAA